MRAILLAAGHGTRLRPLTNKMPKCLAPVGGRPLLEIWLERLVRAGMGPFLVNTHHLAEQVADFVAAGSYGKQVTLVHESVLLGTAGTLLANLDFFQGRDGLLIHADNYCLADLNAFVATHGRRPRECLLTLMTFRTETPSTCGIVEVDDRGVVVGFHEKESNPPGNLANGAVYILSAAFMGLLAREFAGAKDFSTEVLPFFSGRMYSYETTSLFVDIGTPESYRRVNWGGGSAL